MWAPPFLAALDSGIRLPMRHGPRWSLDAGPGPSPGDARRVRIGRLEVDRLTLAGAVDAIERLVRAGRGGAVYTPNVDHVVLAEDDAELRAAYERAELSLADGAPVVWASRLLGRALPEKVSGSDLVVPLLRRAAASGWRVYLLGGGSGVAEEAARRASERLGVRVVGADAARIRLDGIDEETPATLQRIAAARPELLLVGLGAPKQELWIHRHRARLAPAVAIGVGASLDFLAGRARRAPAWLSRAGIEWLWRLLHEPRRLWRRYLVQDPRFVAVLWRALRQQRAGERPS